MEVAGLSRQFQIQVESAFCSSVDVRSPTSTTEIRRLKKAVCPVNEHARPGGSCCRLRRLPPAATRPIHKKEN